MDLHLQKTDIFMQLIDEGKIPLRPGVLRLVDEAIANNVRLAVCSTSNEKAVSNLVSTLMGEARASKFQIFAGDMVKAKKPAPDVYLMAVDKMGLNKNRCVIIEDSHIGVGAAVAAGISCLVTKSSYTAGEDFTGAKMIVEELGADPRTGVTLKTLTGLLENVGGSATLDLGSSAGELSSATSTFPTGSRGIGVQMEDHIERGGASWTGARFGDEMPERRRGYGYTASETYAASSPRGIGVSMEGHIERGGASWTGELYSLNQIIYFEISR
jgi:HAD superfamily hydrolase (TIGR01509 family)